MQQAELKDLYVDELKDIYSAETQLVKALPKMAKAAASDDLRTGFEEHLEQTKGHVARLEQIFEALGEKPTGKKCMGMEGVIKEGAEALEEEGDDTVIDIGIIGAGSRVEHYEMAGYLTSISLAKRLGASEIVSLLTESLNEEQMAEKTLRKIASGLIRSVPAES